MGVATVTAEQLIQYMPVPYAVSTFDSVYAIPTKEWVLGEYSTFYKDFLTKMGLSNWHVDFDCDNFATLFFTLAQCGHARAETRKEGIAIGVFCYVPWNAGKNEAHAINVAVTDKGVIFLEPQTCFEKTLDLKELQSCFQVLF